MIVGMGLDIAAVSRIASALERYGDRFAERILTAQETADLSGRVDRATAVAGRFAAKEAALKALGAPRDVTWHELEVRRGALGAPLLELHGQAAVHAARLGVRRSHLTITHDGGVAAAVVILEGGD